MKSCSVSSDVSTSSATAVIGWMLVHDKPLFDLLPKYSKKEPGDRIPCYFAVLDIKLLRLAQVPALGELAVEDATSELLSQSFGFGLGQAFLRRTVKTHLLLFLLIGDVVGVSAVYPSVHV